MLSVVFEQTIEMARSISLQITRTTVDCALFRHQKWSKSVTREISNPTKMIKAGELFLKCESRGTGRIKLCSKLDLNLKEFFGRTWYIPEWSPLAPCTMVLSITSSPLVRVFSSFPASVAAWVPSCSFAAFFAISPFYVSLFRHSISSLWFRLNRLWFVRYVVPQQRSLSDLFVFLLRARLFDQHSSWFDCRLLSRLTHDPSSYSRLSLVYSAHHNVFMGPPL